jgi:HNH endonuclease
MRSVERPQFGTEQTYTLCISKVQDDELRQRLVDVTADIVDAAEEYAGHAMDEELYLVPQTNGVAGLVTTEEMVAVYNYRMAGKGGPGRSIYDALKLLPNFGICPYCDHGLVSTLDHILPKISFPALAVTPDNLVGACKDCNKAKLASLPTCGEDAALHPYFDDISEELWLGAKVVESDVAAVVFHVVPVGAWSDILNARIKNHFRTLGLGPLYASQAAREISGQRKDMIRLFEARGENGVREELRYKSESWEEYGANCWQAAAFRALSESDWYCGGGFQNE